MREKRKKRKEENERMRPWRYIEDDIHDIILL
jgi:hypothetical protein